MMTTEEWGEEVVWDDFYGQFYTVCDVCNEVRVPIIGGTAERFCEPCRRAGWR